MRKDILLVLVLLLISGSCLFGQVGLNSESFAKYEEEITKSVRELDSLIVELSDKSQLLYEYDKKLFKDLIYIISSASSLSTELRLLKNEFRFLLVLKSNDEKKNYDIRYFEKLGTSDGDLVKDDLIQAWKFLKTVNEKINSSSPLKRDLILLTLLYLKTDAHISMIIDVDKN